MSSDCASVEQSAPLEGEENPVTVSDGALEIIALPATIMIPPNPDRVLWEMDSIRDLFNKRRMWPTFVGPKFIQNGTTKITLPVLVWKEQQQYCMETSQQPSIAGCSLKRKRAESSAEVTTSTDPSSSSRTSSVGNTGAFVLASDHAHHVPPSSSSCSTSALAAQPTMTMSPEERTRCRIFADLHEQGYFVGPADAYGGDFSLYKGGGDPTQTHSIATVRVVGRGHKITARELLAFSRVQNQVAKSAVLAFSLPTTTTTSTYTRASATEAAHNSAAASVDSTHVDGNSTDSSTQAPLTSSCGKAAGESTISGESHGVGYIVINFRNVSDRM